VGGVGGFFAKRRFEVAVAVDDAPSGPASIDDLLALADAQDGAAPRQLPAAAAPAAHPERTEPTSAPSPAPTPEPAQNASPVAADTTVRQPGRQVSTESESFDHFVRELIAQAEGGPLHPEPAFVPATVRVERAPAPVPAPTPVSAVAPAAETQPPTTTTADPRLELLDRLSTVAVVPPTALTGTQVVVGPWEAAMAVARAWVAQCGEGDDAIVDAGTESAGAASARPQGGCVMVVASDGTSAGSRRAGRRLADLGADAVTAVIDARWDIANTVRRLDALRAEGVRVDAVAAHGVADVADPLRLLDLPLPVTWLDARPATLGTWAAPCLDRL
jgi:hypothetical protein